eukprot:COSAG01_NODE_33_length_35013_cov_86.824144_18_plen_75_part_00
MNLEAMRGESISGQALMECYEIFDAVMRLWHGAPSPIPIVEFFKLLQHQDALKAQVPARPMQARDSFMSIDSQC